MGEVLTTTEAGRKLRFGRAVVRKMCEAGQFDGAYRSGTGGHWRIPLQAVKDFIERSRPKKRVRAA